MAYKEKGKGAPGDMLQSGKGLCSYAKNPMKMARQVKPECGPGMNADQKKANMMLQKAQKQEDSLRGMSGM